MANVLQLSKLSRGHVQLCEHGSRLEVLPDASEKPLIDKSRSTQLPHIPKTYSTKRGPLVLFAETRFLKDSKSKSHPSKHAHVQRGLKPSSTISPPPLKFGELKRSILAYGGTPENQLADGVVDEDGTYINMKLPKRKRGQPSKYAGISPNVALKRRYMIASNEERKRELDSILEFEYSNSRNQRHSMMKTHVLSDEISLIPPVYRNPDIAPNSDLITSDTYRFFGLDNTNLPTDNKSVEKVRLETDDALQIVDAKGSQISYETLDPTEKEKVLADLLVQTALQNITDQQNIEIFEDALNRIRDSDIVQSLSTLDVTTLIDDNSIAAFPSDTISETNQAYFKSAQSSKVSLTNQYYMFGKMQGSRWARYRPEYSNTLPTKSKQETNNIERHPDASNTHENAHPAPIRTKGDIVHSKQMRASRLLAPIANANQEHSIMRFQQHIATKVAIKARKQHDSNLNQLKTKTLTKYKEPINTQLQHLSTPTESFSDFMAAANQLAEQEASQLDPAYRQRSSKSIKRNPSRLGTGQTFATGRCVTSPLSIHEDAERLSCIGSLKEGDYDQVVEDNHVDEYSTNEIAVSTDVAEAALLNGTSSTPITKTDEEHDQHIHPSAMNLAETSMIAPRTDHPQRSAYTHQSHGTNKSKNTSIVLPGALLIAPDGEILMVSGPSAQLDNDFEDFTAKNEHFLHQPSNASITIERNQQQVISAAPCVPMILGTKRERLPEETVVRRTLNFDGGDLNSQIDLRSWSYDVPLEQRQILSQSFTLVPPAPPLGLAAFTGRKHHHTKRVSQETADHVVPSTLSIHSEVVQSQLHASSNSSHKNRSTTESHAPLLAFTSWAYQRPPTPPTVKRPYLFKPDYRPSGAHGYKHPIGDTETLIRRTINIHAGDIDASLSFTIWVYDMWINDLIKSGADPHYIKQVKSLFDLFRQRRLSKIDLQDKEFLSALATHAQELAKIILKRSNSGQHLAADAQLAIIENLRNLKNLLDQRLASLSNETYLKILRETLQHVLIKGNLGSLQITDDILMALLEYPIEAFEVCIDADTGEEYIRLKEAYQTRKSKMKSTKPKKKTKTIIISEEISPDNFEQVKVEETDEFVYRLNWDFSRQKGFMDLIDTDFNIITNDKTHKQTIVIKKLPKNCDFKVEIVLDPDTEKQILILTKEVSTSPPSVQADIDADDFEMVTDETSGEPVFRLRVDVAIRKGLSSLTKANFEIVIDPRTGQQMIRIRKDGSSLVNGNRVEIVIDPITGKQSIRVIPEDDNDDKRPPTVIITENDIDMSDFEHVIDPLTGREILRMKPDALKAKGLEDLANAEFEIITDATTGKTCIILKTPSSQLSGGTNTSFEIIVDAVTGKQKLVRRTIVHQNKDDSEIIESQLNADDFERVRDPKTGREVLQLKKGVAARKGLGDLVNVQFEMVTNAEGKTTIAAKGGGKQGSTTNGKFELVTDASGRTTIKVKKDRPPTPEIQVTEKSVDINDFEEVIDSKTGTKVLRLKVDVAKRSGMTELLDAKFETYVDPQTGKQSIRVKQDDGSGSDDVKFEIVTDETGKQVLKMMQEIPKTVEVTDSDISANDFEEVVDANTGKKVLRMKREVAKRKGYVDMDNVDFEYVVDQTTGQQTVQIKGGTEKLKKGHVTFEMVTDPDTGQQSLRMKQEVELSFETIESDLVHDDFEEFIDEVTGERTLRLTAAAAARKGLDDLLDVEFEVYTDPVTGKEEIRMKDGNQVGKKKRKTFELYVDEKTGLPRVVLKRPKGRTPPPMEKSIDESDFEKVTDPTTGKEYFRFTDEAIRRKGLKKVEDMEFDIEVDAKTGKTIMKPKVSVVNGQNVEVIVDPITGEQSIRIIQHKPDDQNIYTNFTTGTRKAATATVTTKIELDKEAFNFRFDATTGKRIIHLSKEIVQNYGLQNIEFEQFIDETTGEEIYRMKPIVGNDGKVYELITDPTTGKQSLQVKETVTEQQLAAIIETREAKGLRIPRAASGYTRMSVVTDEERNFLPTGISTRTRKKMGAGLSSEEDEASPIDDGSNEFRRFTQSTYKPRPMRVKSPSGQEYDIEWTSDDEKELDGLSVYEQRRRKELLIAEKKRKVAEMKRQEELAIQNRLKRQRESLVDVLEQSSELLNKEEEERERDLRKLDTDRDDMSDQEYLERRKKLFAERNRVLKVAYDRKMDRLKRQTGIVDNSRIDGEQAAQLESQIRSEEDLLLNMMNPEEREDYIRARNEERARQRLLAERERMKREEELQAALAETKRMAAIRAAEIMAKELQKRSNNLMYAELKDLVTEQKVSRAFTYSYYSLLQYLAASSSKAAD